MKSDGGKVRGTEATRYLPSCGAQEVRWYSVHSSVGYTVYIGARHVNVSWAQDRY